jgi:hypothetical protein
MTAVGVAKTKAQGQKDHKDRHAAQEAKPEILGSPRNK